MKKLLVPILFFLMVGVSYSQTKISDYNELITKPAGDDLFVIVDKSDTSMAASGTTKKITRDTVFKGLPWDLNWSIYTPNVSMINIFTSRINRTITLSSIGCFVDPADTGESVVIDVYECNSTGTNCTKIIDQVTCGNTPTTATITDSSLASGGLLKLNIIAVTGTVTSLLIYGTGTQDF